MDIQLIIEHKLNNLNFWLKLITDIIPVFIGAALAFYWNVKYEEKKKKKEEVNKNKEFLANLYVLTDSTYGYLKKHLLNENNKDLKKELLNKNNKETKKSEPIKLPIHLGISIYEKPLNVKNISFCSRNDKYYDFIPRLYIFESNIKRCNITFEKYGEIGKKINEQLDIYNKNNKNKIEEEKNISLKEKIDHSLYLNLVDVTNSMVKTVVWLMISCWKHKNTHKKVMEEMYPEFEFKEYKLFDNLKVDEELITNLKKFIREKY